MTIGIIVSSKLEAKILLNHIPEKKKLKLELFEVYYFKLNSYEIFLLICDKNIQSAAKATSLLTKKINPALIISVGTAGAVADDMQVGDVIYANAVTILENGVYEQYIVLSSMISKVRKFIFDTILNNRIRFFMGTLVSVTNAEAFHDYDKIKFSHPVLDMEAIGVAQAAKHKQVQVLALRGITHIIPAHGDNCLYNTLDYHWYFDKRKTLIKIVFKPWILLSLPAYLKNKLVATNNVTSTLLSLLNILSFDILSSADDYQI